VYICYPRTALVQTYDVIYYAFARYAELSGQDIPRRVPVRHVGIVADPCRQSSVTRGRRNTLAMSVRRIGAL